MKYFAVLLLLVAGVYSDDWTIKDKNDLVTARGVCAERYNVPADKLAQFKTWTFDTEDLTKTYVTCIFKELGLFCDHEGFHIDRLVNQFKTAHSVDIQPVVEKCAEKTAEDTTTEAWVFRAFMCFTAEHLPLVRRQLTRSKAESV